MLLSSSGLELSPWSFTHVFTTIETTTKWNCLSKTLQFLQITAEYQDYPFFYRISNDKTLFQNISTTLWQILHQGRYWRKKLPWTILEGQFPVTRNTAASKIGNNVISLLWQLRCHCNPDHKKLSSLSTTTVVAIFPNLCLWRGSLCSNLRGIDPKKLYRATLNNFLNQIANMKQFNEQGSQHSLNVQLQFMLTAGRRNETYTCQVSRLRIENLDLTPTRACVPICHAW